MEITLEMIDSVVSRTNVSFKEAKEALEKTNGDVVEAIIYLESSQKSNLSSELTDLGNEMINKVKEILKKGNVTRITVKKDEEIILNLPVTAAAVGAIISVPLALVGLGGALLSKCTIEIQKEDGEVINVNNMIRSNKDN
ncbi:MAG: DUF4342 domain-containing protein [Tissierellia bacterium]|nr:DUF4342 domain-containing protein [Tissierellia bacterium]